MGFLDDAVTKAKETIDVACKKTNEVVNTQKQKFDASALVSKREKDYAALGKIYFEQVKDDAGASDEVRDLVASVREKSEKIDQLYIEIAQAKNKRICPNCGAAIDKNSVFCSVCGTKLTIDSEEK